jgi:hypothetical protein
MDANEMRATADLLAELAVLAEEREAAYATRAKDPDRWRAAKTAYAEARSYWRAVAQSVGQRVQITPQPVTVGAKVNAPKEA